MPEPIIARCNVCGLTYDQVQHAECPRCVAAKARRARSEEVRKLDEAQAEKLKAFSPWAGPLKSIAIFLAGAVCFMGLTNALIGKPIFGLPVIEVKETKVEAVDKSKKVRGKEDKEDVKPMVLTLKLSDPVLSILAWQKDEPEPGKVRYKGKIKNIAPDRVDGVTVEVIEKDPAGSVLGKGYAIVKPMSLLSGSSGFFSVTLNHNPDARLASFRVTWKHLFQDEVKEVPVSEDSGGSPSEISSIKIMEDTLVPTLEQRVNPPDVVEALKNPDLNPRTKAWIENRFKSNPELDKIKKEMSRQK